MSEKIPNDHTDLMWKTHMRTLMKRTKSMEVAQIIDDALFEYYSEKGLPVPNWKSNKDPEWWTEYLIRLGIDKNNS
jgi:hypothetical protein